MRTGPVCHETEARQKDCTDYILLRNILTESWPLTAERLIGFLQFWSEKGDVYMGW